MTLIKRATIKSYDVGSHRAAVGISGSLSVWLDSIALSDAIPAAAVIVGRECAVLFHEDDNPDDAVIVSIHGGGPPAPASPTSIADADSDTYVRAEQSADEDVLRFGTAGTERGYIDSTGRRKWSQVWGHAFGGSAHDNNKAFNYTPGPESVNSDRVIWQISPFLLPTVANKNFWGVSGNMIIRGTVNVAIVRGLSFAAVADAPSGTPTYTEVTGAATQVGNFQGTPIVTDLTGFRHAAPFTYGNPTFTRYQALWSNLSGTARATDVVGLRIDDITAGTRKALIWAGPNVPGAAGLTNLRLDAGNPPNAGLATEGDSQLYLTFNENGVLAMRQLRWRRYSSLNAADKVVIAQ